MGNTKAMTKDRKRKLHRIRTGWDCPLCKMHFGWRKQFEAHGEICEENTNMIAKTEREIKIAAES
jgi:hypothetical protein